MGQSTWAGREACLSNTTTVRFFTRQRLPSTSSYHSLTSSTSAHRPFALTTSAQRAQLVQIPLTGLRAISWVHHLVVEAKGGGGHHEDLVCGLPDAAGRRPHTVHGPSGGRAHVRHMRHANAGMGQEPAPGLVGPSHALGCHASLCNGTSVPPPSAWVSHTSSHRWERQSTCRDRCLQHPCSGGTPHLSPSDTGPPRAGAGAGWLRRPLLPAAVPSGPLPGQR